MSLLTDLERSVINQTHFNSPSELIDAIEAAVIKKLATVSVEPEVFLSEHHRGEVDPYYSKSDRPHPDFLITPMYFEDQLTTALAAERVHALEEAAAICDRNAQSTSADEIRALINSLK